MFSGLLFSTKVLNTETVIQGGRAAHFGRRAGVGSGEGPSQGTAQRHKIKIFNHHTDQELDVEVPEDRCPFLVLIATQDRPSISHIAGPCSLLLRGLTCR